MAEDQEAPEEGEEGAPKKKGGMMSTIIVGLACGFAGFAVPLILPPGVMSGTPEKEEVENKLEIPDPEGTPEFIAFGEAVVNLDEGRLNRYLRVNIALQVDKAQKAKIEEILTAKKAILRSWLLSYVSDQTMDEIRGAAGQNRLRRAIRDQFNNTLFSDGFDRIEDVLFEDFNIQ